MDCRLSLMAFAVVALSACGGGGSGATVDLGIAPSANADAGSSYTQAGAIDIRIRYDALQPPMGTGDLRIAPAYLDLDGDGDTDVFMATGQYLLQGEVDSFAALNNGGSPDTWPMADATVFGGQMPPATHARKSLTADFDGDGRMDILVLDHGFDNLPFPGAQPKLILQTSPGRFTWSKLPDTGFHHGGAAADIDNDGDLDIFVGGFDPFFYINDGHGSFTHVDDRFDGSIAKVFTAELIDVDKDGYVDLLVGAHERDGDVTSIYWGGASGTYTSAHRTRVPAAAPFGAVLDFDVADVDGDGDRDVIVNRTRDGDDGGGLGFYVGRTLQLLLNQGDRNFTDATAARIDRPQGDPGVGGTEEFSWLRAQDFDGDGDIDLYPDDMGRALDSGGRGLLYRNDGTGHFALEWVTLPT